MKSILIFICACISCIGIHAQMITTIAGNGVEGFSGDGGQATLAELNYPIGITIDEIGNIYTSDFIRIRRINTDGVIFTVAGRDTIGYRGDDSLATIAEFCNINFIKLGYDGNLYIPDICNNRIRKIDLATNIITTFAGNGTLGFHEDGLLATNAQVSYPFGVAFDRWGNLYFGDGSNWVHKINSSSVISRVAGSDSVGGYGGDGGQATNAILNIPVDLAIDLYGNLYISDLNNAVIRKVDTDGVISTYAGDTVWSFYGDGGLATLAQLDGPEGIAVDGEGNVFFADEANNVVRRIDHLTNIITTIAGNNNPGFSGDGGEATNARLNSPTGIAFDSEGNLYIADYYNNRIRKVTNAGVPVGNVLINKCANVLIYPNPAKSTICITSPEIINQISITNIVGQCVYSKEYNCDKVVVDIADLRTGVYFVKVNGVEVRRFVKE